MSDNKIIVPFEVKQIEEVNNFFIIRGLASTFGNIDEGNEIVANGAFDSSLIKIRQNSVHIDELPGRRKLLPVLWVHRLTEPIGSFTEIQATSEGLAVEAVFPKSDTFVTGRVIPQVKVRSVAHMSIGFRRIKTSFNSTDESVLLEILDLLEISLTPLAENTQAIIQEFKSKKEETMTKELPLAEKEALWKPKEALERVKEFTKAEDAPNADYAKAFLYVDSDDLEDYDAYKFQFADVVDGEMKAIPDGVMSAAAQFHADKEINAEFVKNEIVCYYKKLGLASPFIKRMCFRVDNIESLVDTDVRCLEKVIKQGFVLPGKSAKTLISKVKNSSMRDADEAKTDDRDEKLSRPHFDALTKLLGGYTDNAGNHTKNDSRT